MVMHKKWFLDRLRQRKLSQRHAAELLKMDASALSLLLNGKRRMKLDEVPRFAEVLGSAPRDVMAAAGIDVTSTNVAAGELPVMGRIDTRGGVEITEKPIGVIQTPNAYADGLVLRSETALSPLDLVDGWHLIVASTPVPADEAVGHLAVCEVEGGGLHLRWLMKGYVVGLHRLVWMTTIRIEQAAVVSARPVKLIVPA